MTDKEFASEWLGRWMMGEIDFERYDREGLEILAQTQHDQLEAQDEQLAELRGTQQAAIDEALRRQTGSPAAVVRAAMAVVDEQAIDGVVRNSTWDEFTAAVEQLRGATAERRPKTCRSCVHFERDAPPTASGDGSARPCSAADGALAHPDGGAKCKDYAPDTEPAPQLPGVEIDGNVVRSEGGDES